MLPNDLAAIEAQVRGYVARPWAGGDPGETVREVVCECGDPDCTELIRLSLEEYEHVRSSGNRFLIATGHYALNAVTIEEHARYVIVEKHGVAGRIAEEDNRRK